MLAEQQLVTPADDAKHPLNLLDLTRQLPIALAELMAGQLSGPDVNWRAVQHLMANPFGLLQRISGMG